MKLKKGDTIIVSVGKDKGKKGKIESVFPTSGSVMVAGINMFKRHMKKRDEKKPSSIIDITKPIGVSKVALVCPKCSLPTRVGYIVVKDEKVRICRKCQQKI